MDPRNEFTLSWWDYLLLILTLGSSALIGIYYSFSKKKPKTLDEYMFGNMNMPWLPILLSNMSSAISSAAIVVLPRETYYYGNQMMFVPIAELSTLFYNYFFFLPVLLKLRFTSIFENAFIIIQVLLAYSFKASYLEKRFNKFVRCCGSLIYFATQMMFSLITIYSAGKAVSEVLPISFFIFTPAACMLCTVYTALGGLRGVVWVDAVQAIIMFLSITIFIIVGIYDVGGVQKVIDTYENGGRTDIDLLDFSPFVRNSPVTTLISSYCFSLTRTVINQGIVQRYKSLPTYRKARVISIFSHVGNATLLFLPIIFGIIMYASYHDCDPGMSKLLEDTNQLSIYYILDKSRNIPGFIGLLIACVLSAAFSTMSTIMNSVSAVLYEDFLKPLIPWELTEAQTNIIIKSSVIILGIINAVCIFALDDIGSIYQLMKTTISFTNGVIIFLFLFGMFFRVGNSKGAIAGGLASLIVSIWLGVGIQNAVSSGKIKYLAKIVSIEGCSPNITEKLDLNVTTEGYLGYVPTSFDDDLPYPYRLSFNLISILAVISSIIVGLIVSTVSSNNETVDESLLIPQLRKTKRDKEIFSAEEMEILNAAEIEK